MIQKSKGKIQNSQQGFTMIEMIVTIAILSFGILGLYELFYPMITQTRLVSLRFTAANLAQEGLEIARNMRDNNFIASATNPSVRWSDGLLDCEAGCQLDYKTDTAVALQASALSAYNPNAFLKINAEGLYGYEAGEDTPFKREVIIQRISTDVLKVVANVYWEYAGRAYTFTADQYLYDWY